MFVGVRVRQAREIRGWTQAALAERIGVSQPFVAQLEAGLKWPTDDVTSRLAFQTGFSMAFFRSAPLELPLGSLLFRARARLPASDRRAAHRFGELAFEVAAAFLARLERDEPRLPRLRAEDKNDPVHAAALTRAALGLPPEAPIRELMSALERAGVLLISVPLATTEHDAFSFWSEPPLKYPVVVLFRGAPPDRLRFNLAHEIGHLVMHSAPSPNAEREAHLFASSLLIPPDAVLNDFPTPLTLTDLAQLKPRWGVSMQALAMAAFYAGGITARERKLLFQQISRRRWRRMEPGSGSVVTERPSALRQMARLLYGDPPNLRRIASETSLPLAFIEALFDDTSVIASLGTESIRRSRSDQGVRELAPVVELRRWRRDDEEPRAGTASRTQ